jgi:HEAT repeat protein
MTPDQAIPALRSMDPTTRALAADDLRSDDATGVPPAAVPALLQALSSEPEPKVRGALLMTLGRSGAPEAKDPIDEALAEDPDPYVQKCAKRALAYWRVQNAEPRDESWSYWVPVWQPTKKAGAN